MTKMKNVGDIKKQNSIEALNSRKTKAAEQKIKDIHNQEEITRKQHKVKNLGRKQQHTRELWDKLKRNNVGITEVPKIQENVMKKQYL